MAVGRALRWEVVSLQLNPEKERSIMHGIVSISAFLKTKRSQDPHKRCHESAEVIRFCQSVASSHTQIFKKTSLFSIQIRYLQYFKVPVFWLSELLAKEKAEIGSTRIMTISSLFICPREEERAHSYNRHRLRAGAPQVYLDVNIAFL